MHNIKFVSYYKTEAEKNLLDNFRRYPTLYANRTQVLAHWFLRYGTGMQWHNGRLIQTIQFRGKIRIEGEAAAQMCLSHGFATLGEPSINKYEPIFALKDAREDYKILGLSLIAQILSWKPAEYAACCNYFYPSMSAGCRKALVKWKPILRNIKRECTK